MKKSIIFFALFLFIGIIATAQIPNPALIGYWHNWNDVNAPYIQLDQIDSRYNIVEVAFAVPHSGTDYQMEFIPDQVTAATFINQMQNLQSQGKKVIISMGGSNATISLSNTTERDAFITSVNNILNTYNFDGIDIDFEGSSIVVTGGTIASPTDPPIINLIYAVKQIMQNYYASHSKRLILTMAPETAFVQGGMSAYGNIWGAYLPVIHALRDSLEILHVQLYNSGTMYGIDGNIYTQGTADFIVAMTEAVIQGFNTAGGTFIGLPSSKIAVGLPACSNAAGGGFVDTATVKAALNYLRGNGAKPGSYTLAQAGGYPTLRGMMTWSVNWDALSTCGTVYQYARNYASIFGGATGCGVPASLSTSNITTSSATLNWGAVSGAVSYTLQYRAAGTATWTSSTSTTNSKVISGLTASTQFEYQVLTVCTSSSSAFSASAYFTTLSAGGNCVDNYEPNNASGSAKLISVNTDIKGLISPSSDNDYFKFNNTVATPNIKITLTTLPANYNVKLIKSGTLATGSNSGVTDETIIYNTSIIGTYKVKVYGVSGANNATSCYTLKVQLNSTPFRISNFDNNTATEEVSIITEQNQDEIISAYPNPVKDILNIKFNSLEEGKVGIKVLDVLGRTVIESQRTVATGMNNFELSMSQLIDGIYFIGVTGDVKRAMRKIILEKH